MNITNGSDLILEAEQEGKHRPLCDKGYYYRAQNNIYI